MSQAGVTAINSGNLPPNVPTTFTEDTGSATPANNILNIFGGYTSNNDDDGITTVGNGGNTVTILLTNRFNTTTTTSGAVTTTILSFVTGADGVYTVEAKVSGYAAIGSGGASFKLYGGFIKSGGVLSPLLDVDKIYNNNAVAAAANASFTTGANNINLEVTGVAGLDFNWRAVGTYTLVS